MIRTEAIDEFYEVGGELGRGKFAVVRKYTEKSSGKCYAAKYLRKRRRGCDCREDILKEIDIMRTGKDQQRIIQVKEVFEAQREIIIILELAEGGELFRRIAEEPLSEHDARKVVRQILEGVLFLHDRDIVHMDLKPENILIHKKGGIDIKVADFGLAVKLHPGQILRNLVGTAEYVAPEILNYEPISCASDMWSIGALTYALMTGYSPFQGETTQETFLNVSLADYNFEDEIFTNVSEHAKDFISKLLLKKARDRITAKECLSHPWMTSAELSRPLPSHYESSTSVDSSISLSMDNVLSSCETSPISSTTSSFAAGGHGSCEVAVTDEEKSTDCEQQVTYSSENFRASLQKSLHGKLGPQSPDSPATTHQVCNSTRSQLSPELQSGSKQETSLSSGTDHSRHQETSETLLSVRPEGCVELSPVPSLSPINGTDSLLEESFSQDTLTRQTRREEVTCDREERLSGQGEQPLRGRECTRSTKKVSPEIREEGNILQLLRNGMSLIDDSNSADWGNSPSKISKQPSTVKGQVRTGKIPTSNHSTTTTTFSSAVPTTSVQNSVVNASENTTDTVKFLTVGMPLSNSTSNELEPAPFRESSPQPSTKGRNHEKKPLKWRPDSFILPLEVQEAILKGNIEPQTIYEEATHSNDNSQ